MIRWLMALALGMGASSLAAQVGPADAVCRTSQRARSLCATDSLLTDATRRNDAAALDRIYAAEYHFTTVRGTEADRADQLRAFRSGEMRFDSAAVSERQIRLYDCAAVITGRRDQVATVRGEPRPSAVRFTHTYIWGDGRWRLVASQNTPIAPDARLH